jgi:hypothetical protein
MSAADQAGVYGTSIYPSINRFKDRELEMAQAKKPQQEDEPGGPMSQVQFVEQTRALNEQIVETATRVGQDALQRYVDWLQAVADMQRTLASSPQASQMDWFASMMKAKADFNEQFAKMVGGMPPWGQQPQS